MSHRIPFAAICRNFQTLGLTPDVVVIYVDRFSVLLATPNKVILLAIDPGITTGVALLDYDGSVIESYEVNGDEAYAIVALIAEETSNEVVIERGPAARSNTFLDELDGWLRAVYPDARWMYPGEWKGTPRAMQDVSGVLSHHAKDAVRMGREYLFQRALA